MLEKLLRLINLDIRTNTHEHLFNVPVKVRNGQASSINERVIELAIVHRHLAELPLESRILEFGCSRSWLAITLSAMGYNVIGSDLRDYEISHPSFQFEKGEIQNLDIEPVDCIVAISTLEHVGLGAYNESADESALNDVMRKLHDLLTVKGWLLLTVPVGSPAQDSFQRIFSPSELKSLLSGHGFKIEKVDYFTRTDETTWLPAQEDALLDRQYSSGVSSVACLKCIKD